MQSKNAFGIRRIAKIVSVAGLLGAASFLPVAASTADIAADAQAQALKTWHQTMRQMAPPMEGCFHASFPSVIWEKATCEATSYRSNPHVKLKNGMAETVGNGDDYAATTTNLTSSATGSFPVVTGVTSETDGGTANSYTLQLNTNLSSSSPACASYGYSSCQVWQQFIYSSSYVGGVAQVFMQDWMFIPSRSRCPRSGGWTSYKTSSYNGCYKNSTAVNSVTVPASQLGNLKLAGSVVANGNDTVTFTNGTEAYAVSQPDSTLGAAHVWNQSEFNIVGNGGGSAATFNSGSSVTVNLQVNDNSTSAPGCAANDGTTGETNNLNLGSCSAVGGSSPYIQFTESN
ncbi:hypothetical protein [Rhodanobacter sp. DHG33]|uniref:hypothetical protein n=1 Tax=Rhodanobacter sp. DHG33 TaxID=2775921 RepID=UPI0017848E98|nr:hypothetical protein [Rhodanobacter sp. DHG33]MBD8898149.1 hypothetical protein [Rhodanobacter sp. DHG33]